jgi:lipoic acid synthetase
MAPVGQKIEIGAPKPSWLKTKATFAPSYVRVKNALRSNRLHSVCEEANCPNIRECFSHGTATFMILGNICTRGCRFCDVIKGRPLGYDLDEPRRMAEGVAALGLQQVVITSVNRDDLPDGGSWVFAETIRQLRARDSRVRIEVLIPDFDGNFDALEAVLEARPDVLNHNVETVPRLYPSVRPRAKLDRSLEILRRSAARSDPPIVKSGIMAGVGETWDELLDCMRQIVRTGCQILTIGQYLAPSATHLPVDRYYPPTEFEKLARAGEAMGFAHVESGPLVRSSYHAFDQVSKMQEKSLRDAEHHSDQQSPVLQWPVST